MLARPRSPRRASSLRDQSSWSTSATSSGHLRTEEQKASVFGEELRAARAELDSLEGVARRRAGRARGRPGSARPHGARGVPGPARRRAEAEAKRLLAEREEALTTEAASAVAELRRESDRARGGAATSGSPSARPSCRRKLAEREAELQHRLAEREAELQEQISEQAELLEQRLSQRESELTARVAEVEAAASSTKSELDAANAELETGAGAAAGRSGRDRGGEVTTGRRATSRWPRRTRSSCAHAPRSKRSSTSSREIQRGSRGAENRAAGVRRASAKRSRASWQPRAPRSRRSSRAAWSSPRRPTPPSRSCGRLARPRPPPNRSWNGSAPSRKPSSRRSRTPRLVTRPRSPPPRQPPPSKPDLEEVLRASQERLASQTEKLIEVEERAHSAERQFADSVVRPSKRSRPSSAISRWRRRCTTCKRSVPAEEVADGRRDDPERSPRRTAVRRPRSPRSSRSTRRSRCRTSWGSRRS